MKTEAPKPFDELHDHVLKTINPYFQDVWDGKKDFEVRKNDRNFEVGQIIKLEEYGSNRFNFILKEIKYILPGGQYGIDKDYVVLGLKDVNFTIRKK